MQKLTKAFSLAIVGNPMDCDDLNVRQYAINGFADFHGAHP